MPKMNDALYDVFSYMIRQAYPNVQNIRLPGVVGAQQNVLFANVDGADRVFKFSTPELVKKNVAISQAYQQHDIPVPNILEHQIDFLVCEEYDIIPGISLFEAIRNGIGGAEVRAIYRDVVDAFAKMRTVHYRPSSNDSRLFYAHNFARFHVSDGRKSVMANVVGAATYLMNLGDVSDSGLYHYDITPKNIILSPDNKFAGLVDLDSVGVCNKNFAFGVMATKYQQIGFDCKELMDYYIDTTSDTLQRGRIIATAKINAAAKKMIWKHRQNNR